MKYKINYKANDNWDYSDDANVPFADKLVAWFEERGYNVWDKSSSYMQIVSPDKTRCLIFYLATRKVKCDLVNTSDGIGGLWFSGPVDFTNEELQFLDSMGFELDGDHKEMTGQSIEDWF